MYLLAHDKYMQEVEIVVKKIGIYFFQRQNSSSDSGIISIIGKQKEGKHG
jgi:hypothetical protein